MNDIEAVILAQQAALVRVVDCCAPLVSALTAQQSQPFSMELQQRILSELTREASRPSHVCWSLPLVYAERVPDGCVYALPITCPVWRLM